MKKIKRFFVELYQVLRLPELLILPGNIAFFLLLSLIPIVTLIGVLASLFSLSTGTLVDFISSSLPNGVAGILIPFVDGSNLSTSNVVFVILGFYLSSNGPDSLIIASIILYKLDNQVYVLRRIKALFMTFWLVILIVFILVFLAFGNLILDWLLNFEFWGYFITSNYLFIIVLKYVIAFFFVLFTW